MKPEEMKIISEHLSDAITKEDLPKREASRYLNLNPIYITMALNERYWSSMSKDAWYRLIQWHNSRGKISEFSIPDDEPIWKPAKKAEPVENFLRDPGENQNLQLINLTPAPKSKIKPEEQKELDRNLNGIRLSLVIELRIRQEQLLDELIEVRKLLKNPMYISDNI